MPRKAEMTIVGLVTLTAALFGLCALCPISNTLFLRPLLALFDSRYVPGHVEPRPFDHELWRAGKGRQRVGMAQDLASKKLLNGMTHAELVEMLGEPDVERPEQEEAQWLLGFHAKGLFDETVWLRVTIGENRKARDAGVGVDWDGPRPR